MGTARARSKGGNDVDADCAARHGVASRGVACHRARVGRWMTEAAAAAHRLAAAAAAAAGRRRGRHSWERRCSGRAALRSRRWER